MGAGTSFCFCAAHLPTLPCKIFEPCLEKLVYCGVVHKFHPLFRYSPGGPAKPHNVIYTQFSERPLRTHFPLPKHNTSNKKEERFYRAESPH